MSQNPKTKLFVDDLRDPPSDDWVIARTASEAIELLKTGEFSTLSLDHDLGEIDGIEVPSGYSIAVWLEEQAFNGNWAVVPDAIGVHSANPPGAKNIQAAIDSIDRMRSPKERMRP